MPRSITRRLLVSNLLVLATFLGLTGTALDRAFRISSETALHERLQAHVYTLLATAEADPQGRMRLPTTLGVPGFDAPDSGLYAQVYGEHGEYHWRSESLLGAEPKPVTPIPPGDADFAINAGMAVLRFGITWEDDSGRAIPYTLSISVQADAMRAEQAAFRNALWTWLGGLAVLLLLVQLLLVRWGLTPLRTMTASVRRIERGESGAIDGPVPAELQGLSDNLNALIRHNESRQQRVRNSLADLAHSLKTPLAVLRGSTASADPADIRRSVIEQTQRIDQIISYQRQRAAVAGSGSLGRRIGIEPVLVRLVNSLNKVHARRDVHGTVDGAAQISIRADEGDMLELFGNLLENAYRFAKHEISVAATSTGDRITIRIEDDGPGIAASEINRLLRRGERADGRHPGEGIGLAVVDEIVRQYGWTLSVGRSDLGGAQFRVEMAN